jgi:hypothetical protein
MVVKNFKKSLSGLKNRPVSVSEGNVPTEFGMACALLLFANGSKLQTFYWRVIKDGRAGMSSFDHRQKYGSSGPIDAIKQLQEDLQGKIVVEAQLDKETGDLLFDFTESVKLQVFNFGGYEVWEISFPDGTGEYSNYAK